jgi:hypothetical protein
MEHGGSSTLEQIDGLAFLMMKLHRSCGDRKIARAKYKKLVKDEKRRVKDWKDSWLAVDRILDSVLMESKLLQPYEESVSAGSDADSNALSNANQGSRGSGASHSTHRQRFQQAVLLISTVRLY